VAPPGISWILTPREIKESDGGQVGGKALALVRLMRAGFRVPTFLCVPAGAYQGYLFRGFLQRSSQAIRVITCPSPLPCLTG